MANPNTANMFYSNAPTAATNVDSNQRERIYHIRDVDDICAEVNQEYFEHTRSECYKWLLNISDCEPGMAAVVLNVYRLNFGGDPVGFAHWISALPKSHLWYAEYSRANLAWNLVRIGLRLVRRGGLGDDIDNSLGLLVQGLMEMSDVSHRGAWPAGRPFPFDMPLPLICWHAQQPEFVSADCERSPLHKSLFYSERTLRDFAENVIQQIQHSLRATESAVKSESSQLDVPVQGQDGRPKVSNTDSDGTSSRQLQSTEFVKGVTDSLESSNVDSTAMDDNSDSKVGSDNGSDLSEHSDAEFEGMELEGASDASSIHFQNINTELSRTEIETNLQPRCSLRVYGQRRPDYAK